MTVDCRFLCAMLVVAVFNCSNDTVAPVAGGDDFPNSKTIAMALADNTKLYSNWNQFSLVPAASSTDLRKSDSLIVNAIGTHAGLGKSKVAGLHIDSIAWDLHDTAAGIASLYYLRNSIVMLASEKRTVRWDTNAKDSIIGNEFVHAIDGKNENLFTKATLYYSLIDGDRNGFLDTATISLVEPFLGINNVTTVQATSGNDNSFTIRDKRRIFFVQTMQIVGADTLQRHELRDADGDGAILKANARNAVFATIANRSAYPILTNQRALSTINLRATLPTGDSMKWEVNWFNQTAVYTDGHRESITIAGNGPAGSIVPDDSAYILYETLAGTSSRYDSSSVRFSIQLGATINDVTKHALKAYTVRFVSNYQNPRLLVFAFTATTPISAKTPLESVGGTIHAEIRLNDGTSGVADASFGNRFFEITYQTSDGTTKHFKCGQDGVLIE
jgi:hypothetical protein